MQVELPLLDHVLLTHLLGLPITFCPSPFDQSLVCDRSALTTYLPLSNKMRGGILVD
jgi:hypothetical protein